MAARILHRSDVAVTAAGAIPLASAILADLGFPCHLDCVPCRRQRPPSPREYGAVVRMLTEAAAEPQRDHLRVVFHGGDVFTQPAEFERLLEAVADACVPGHVAFDAAVISDGVAWERERVARFYALGVRHYQVALDGPPALHDAVRPLHGGGRSFEHILHSVRQRGRAQVVVRVDPGIAPESVRELVALLDAAALFRGENPVTVFVAPAAPYHREARELLQVLDFVRRDDAPNEGTVAAVPSGRD